MGESAKRFPPEKETKPKRERDKLRGREGKTPKPKLRLNFTQCRKEAFSGQTDAGPREFAHNRERWEGEKTSKGKAAGQKPRANEGAPEEGACDAVTPCSLKDLVPSSQY